MNTRPRLYHRIRGSAQGRTALFVTGCVLMAIAPLLGPLPGPGFLVLFPIGLALVLQNSAWAKRRYVHFKRRHPRYGYWVDRVLRRASTSRRAEKEALAGANPPSAD